MNSKPTYEELENEIKLLKAELAGAKQHCIDADNKIIELNRFIENSFSSDLKNAELKFSTIFTFNPNPIALTEITSGKIMDVNKAFCEWTGYSRDELIGKTTSELSMWHNSADREKFIHIITKYGVLNNHEFTVRLKSGQLRQVLFSASIIVVNNRNMLLTVSHDITTVSELQRILQKNEEHYRTLITVLSEGIIYLNREGLMYFANPAAGKIFGLDNDSINGMSLYNTNWHVLNEHGETISNSQFPGILSLETGISINDCVLAIEIQPSKLLWLSVNSTPVFNKNNGQIEMVVVSFRDITAYRESLFALQQNSVILERQNIELNKAILKAEESDRLKTAFLCNLSHEIRTPMNSIIGFADMLTEPNLSADKNEEFIEAINQNCNQLLQIVNDIIDISLIETNQLELNLSKISLNTLIDEVCKKFIAKKEQKKLNFFVNKGLSDTECFIKSDETKIKQILTNLLDNAFKFTDNGFIKLDYLKLEKEIIFTIEDTGIGIEQSLQKLIFEQFRQAETGNIRKYGGTGLGLSISKGLIEFIGGKIWVESTPGKGSKFNFSIPYTNESPDIQKKIFMEQENYGTILIVEDEEFNFLFVKEILAIFHCKILWAQNGSETLEIVKNENNIRLIIMDIKLPDTNGYELTLTIKEILPNVPVIALTAYALTGDKEKALKSGCTEYVSKPVRKNDLRNIVSKYLNQ